MALPPNPEHAAEFRRRDGREFRTVRHVQNERSANSHKVDKIISFHNRDINA